MFSANENILLRQHKRRIVAAVENTMPEEALDMGTSVMVMQVSCKDPGCVPLETAIIIVFPACGGDGVELLKGLPESNGGSYKTKILKPMADVTDDDVLDNLPPAFAGGRRTMERVCTYARDVMIAQITQLFGEGGSNNNNNNSNSNSNNTAEEADDSAQKDRIAMARFLQACLQDYIDGGCKPPPLGEPFANAGASSNVGIVVADSDPVASASTTSTTSTTSTSTTNATDNNPLPETTNGSTTTTTTNTNTNTNTTGGTTTSVRIRQPPQHERAIRQTLRSRDQILSRLFEREHAPGIRKPGCPCCDPSDPAVLMDSFAML